MNITTNSVLSSFIIHKVMVFLLLRISNYTPVRRHQYIAHMHKASEENSKNVNQLWEVKWRKCVPSADAVILLWDESSSPAEKSSLPL